MAMVVVSILMVGISPVLGFAFATRVQARRIELASRAANSYISAVRADPTNEHQNLVLLNPSEPNAGPTSRDDLFCVDNDGTGGCETDSPTDMMVQGIGINECSNNLEEGYQLIVRVYRADAFAQSEPPRGSGHVASSRVGLGSPRDPLVEVRTEIAPFNDPDNPRGANFVFQNWRDRLEGEGCISR